MGLKKTFVLDTNVLAYDPRAIFAFEENDIVIPIVVIEELDKLKKGVDETSRNARQVSRIIDQLGEEGKRLDKKSKLAKGIKLPGGGTLRIELNHLSMTELTGQGLRADSNDSRILNVAFSLSKGKKKPPVILVSKDTNMRIKADALGIRAEDLESDKIADINELYTGFTEASMPRKEIDLLYGEGGLALDQKKTAFHPNQFVMLKNTHGSTHTVLSRYDHKRSALVPVEKDKHRAWGINSKNREQQLALDLLLDDDIKLVSLVGKAGTGKTLLALAAGLERTVEKGLYSRLVVSRPIFPLGKDIGYLPGEIDDKLRPWMQPIHDSLNFLMNNQPRGGNFKDKKNVQNLFEAGIIEVEPLTYIRGRSMPHQFFIVDEAQNLTPHELKTIITRVGEGTKIVLTGDPYQIDNPYLDASSNGLSYVVEKFKTEPIAGHITLFKGERSELAELAATIL